MEELEEWEWAKGETDLRNYVLEFSQPIPYNTFCTFFKPKLELLNLDCSQVHPTLDNMPIYFVFVTKNNKCILSISTTHEVEHVLLDIGWSPYKILNANDVFSLHCIV